MIEQSGYTRHNHRDLWFSRVEEDNGLMASVHFEQTIGGKPSIRFGVLAKNLPFALHEEKVKVLDDTFQEAVEMFADLDHLISAFEYRPGEPLKNGQHTIDELHLKADPNFYIDCDHACDNDCSDRFISASMETIQWDADGHSFVSIFNAMRAIEHVATDKPDPDEPEPVGFQTPS